MWDSHFQADKSALLVVDMQRGFVDPNGPIAVPGAETIVEPIIDLVRRVRAKGIPVVWTRVSLDGFRRSVYRYLWPHHFSADGSNLMPRGSPWHHIVEPLAREISSNDLVIDKDRYNAFFQTNLELRLRQSSIEQLLVCGVTTNVCVEGSIRGAFERDFTVFLVADCTCTFSAELQSASEQIVALVLGYVVHHADIVRRLDRP